MKIKLHTLSGAKRIKSEKTFPVVYKNSELESVAIVYWKRVEYYGGTHKGRVIISGEDYDPFNEIEMLRGSGYKQVKYTEYE